MAEIVVLTAHPRLEHSRVNQALLQAAQALPGERIQVRDLYALYPDYLIDIPAERAALEGKDLWLVVSTGGVESAYHPAGQNQHFIDDFWPPMAQTARVAGMRFLPPLVLHGAHRVSDEVVREHAALFADRLSRYPAWPELEDLPPEAGCEVPDDDRPHRKP
jgi:glutathione-regulated potassium-efflux system ancillary protein KefF